MTAKFVDAETIKTELRRNRANEEDVAHEILITHHKRRTGFDGGLGLYR